jgi:hypothetical protein
VLGLEHGHVVVQGCGIAVPLGERGHADGEVTDLTDQGDELRGVLDPARRGHPLGPWPVRRVAAQRQHVAHPGVDQRLQDPGELLGGVPHAGQVGHRQHRGLARDPTGDRNGPVARRTPGTVGDRDERRPQRLELADRAPQHLLAGLVLGREELK